MSVNYVDKSTGDLIRVAGQGKAEYGASTERKGDIVIPATTAGNFQSVNVVFAQAMPDNDYAVVIDEGAETWAHGTVNVTNKTTAGFTLFFLNVAGADAPQMTFKYRAFKLYTDTEYNNLLDNAVLKSDVTDSVTNGNMNPVTSNAVAEALADTYSTTETKTNKVWIDGKPIYRKVIHYTGVVTSASAASTVIGSIAGFADIVNFTGTFRNNADNNCFSLNYGYAESDATGLILKQIMPFVIGNEGNVVVARSIGFDITNINIVVEYTKA